MVLTWLKKDMFNKNGHINYDTNWNKHADVAHSPILLIPVLNISFSQSSHSKSFMKLIRKKKHDIAALHWNFAILMLITEHKTKDTTHVTNHKYK